jgi:hypothetical protein
MGGWGSGKRWSSKSTTSDHLKLDVRHLQRKSVLERGYSFSWGWTRDGEPAGNIVIRPEDDRVILTYRSRSRGDEWESLEYAVELEWLFCHLGGQRVYFRCPARGCGRRVAILYGGRIFACRRCHDLAYDCQKELPHHRAMRKAHKLADRLKGTGCLDDPAFRPKGMHRKTFNRLERRYIRAQRQMNSLALAHFGRFI